MTYIPALIGALIPIGSIVFALIVLKSTRRKAGAEASTAEIAVVESVRNMLNSQTDRVNAEIVRMELRVQYVETANASLLIELGLLKEDNTKKNSRIMILETRTKSKDRRITTLENIIKANGLTVIRQQTNEETQT